MDGFHPVANIIALVAGALVLLSMIPEIWRNIKKPCRAKEQSGQRALFQAAGNALWALDGLLTGNLQLTAVAILGCCLSLTLLAQICRAQRARPGDG